LQRQAQTAPGISHLRGHPDQGYVTGVTLPVSAHRSPCAVTRGTTACDEAHSRF